MQLDWTTFAFEIVNFVILVWILKRFLYRPVLEVIDRRQKAVHDTVAEAQRTRSDAEQMREEYEQRLEDWAQKEDEERLRLNTTLQHERERRMHLLDEDIQKESKRRALLADRKQSAIDDARELEALSLGAEFAARLLRPLAGPEIERGLIERFVQNLGEITEVDAQRLRTHEVDASEPVIIASAHPLDDAQRERITAALSARALPDHQDWRFVVEPKLGAGLEVSCGTWVLHANLEHELALFAQVAHETEDSKHAPPAD